jgi:hypothetical protein
MRYCVGELVAVLLAVLAIPTVAAAKLPDFTGMWGVADVQLIIKPDDDGSPILTFDSSAAEIDRNQRAPDFSANFTEETLRRRANFRAHYDTEREDQVKFCVPHGMPWVMLSRVKDYLIDIYQTRDRVTMLFEGMDVHRLIHFNEAAPPDNVLPSTNGYSIAHWEGNTLVIETTHLSARNIVGLKQRSDQAQVTERWSLINHPKFGKALDIDLTVVDPMVYIHPAKGHQLLIPAKPGSTLNAYGCNETLWEEHLRQLQSPQSAK